MTGLIEDFCRSGRRNVAKTSREAFPYLLKLLNACRVILEQNVQKWDASPQEDPVYELIKKVADILVQYSEPNVKFNMQDLLEKVKAIPTKISNFSQGIEREFNKLKPIEEQKAQALRQTTGKLERFLKKAGSVISSDETFHVEVVLYKEPCKTELAGPVSNCRPDNTVDLLLLDLLVQGHFRKDFSLQDNPHFFPRARGRSDPIPFRLDPLPFHQILETINGRKTKYSEPLKLYCVMDQWRYPRLLLKAVPQRAFTNLWVLPDGEILIKEITGKFVSSKDKKMAEAYKSGTHHITKKFNSKDVEDSRPEVGLSWKQLLETMRESSSENWSIEVKALETLHEDSRFGDSDSEESAETIDEVVYLSAESEKKKPESLGSGRPKFDWSDTSQTLVGSADLVTRKVWSLEEQFAPKRDGLPVQDKTQVIPQGTQLHRRKDRVTQMSMAYEPVVPSRVAPPARDVIRPLQSSSHPLRATGPYAHLGSDEDSSRTQRTQDASQTANKKPNRLTPERFTPFSQNAEQKFPNDRPRHLRLTKPSSRDDASPGNTPTFVRARPDPIDNPRNGVATQVKENLRRGSTTLNVSNSSIRPDTAISSHHDDPTPQGGKHDSTSELTNSSNLRRDEFVVESERIPSGARPGKRESNAHTLQSTQPHVQNGHSPPSAPIVQSRPGTPSHFRSSRPSNVPPSDLAGNATSPPRGQEPKSHAQKFDGRGPPEPSTHKSSPLPKQSMQPVDLSYIYPTPAQPKKRADLVDITSARANGASTTTNQTSPSTAQSSSSSSRNHLPAADTVNSTKNTESPVRPGTPAKEDQQHTNHSRSSTPTAKPNTAAWEASLSRNLAALERQGGGQEGKMTSVLPTVSSKSAGDNQHVPMKQDARTTTPQPLPSPTPPAPGRRRRWYDPIVDAIWRK